MAFDQAAYNRDYYQRNRERILRTNSDSARAARARLYDIVNEYKQTHPCADCGQTFHPAAMHFHHIGEKRMAIAKMVSNKASAEVLREEMSHCELLCANCHAIRHWSNAHYGRPELEEVV